MLFGLNTACVLTLIDVAVCRPPLLQTQITHTSGYYRLGGVRQHKNTTAHNAALLFFLKFFWLLFPHFFFPPLLFRRKQRHKVRVNRQKRSDTSRETGERGGERGREDLYIVANGGEAGLCRGVTNHQFHQRESNTSARRSSDTLVAVCVG